MLENRSSHAQASQSKHFASRPTSRDFFARLDVSATATKSSFTIAICFQLSKFAIQASFDGNRVVVNARFPPILAVRRR
jgi:hypothetical protein